MKFDYTACHHKALASAHRVMTPCTDDSGITVGVAADAQRFFSGNAKLEWDVYAGEPFQHDIAQQLHQGAVIAWVHGQYEIGPRALGRRSLLAPPFAKETADRLNRIKQRESYRPVAPVCLEEEVSKWFEWQGPSPYTLHFQMVRSPQLQAVTHDDGSARVQTVRFTIERDLDAMVVDNRLYEHRQRTCTN